MNKIILVGNVSWEPELLKGLCKFQLATNAKKKQEDGTYINAASFHQIIAFGKQGDTIYNHVKKGDLLGIEGSLQYNEYDKNGEKKKIAQIIVDKFHFFPRVQNKEKEVNGNKQYNQASNKFYGSSGFDDEIPF